MTWAEAALVAGSLGGLVSGGWVFLNRTLYRDFEEKDQVVQVSLCLNALKSSSQPYQLSLIYSCCFTLSPKRRPLPSSVSDTLEMCFVA